MAYKIVNKTQLDYDLKRLADAIRNKNGTSGNLTFPNGMSETIRGWTIQNSYYDPSYSPSLSPDPAKYVLVDGADLDDKITTICDAFRSIYGNSSMKIQFPDELIHRIEGLDITHPSVYSGEYYITGTYISSDWGGFEQYLSGYIAVRGNNIGYEGPFDKLILSDDTMTLYIYYQGSWVASIDQSNWVWGSDGLVVIISETQNVSSKFKTWWDSCVVAAPAEEPDITFYYQGIAYTVAPNTTWYDFVSDNCPISTLVVLNHMPGAPYYIFDMDQGSYVGDYETNRAVEGSDVIVENRYYYSGFELPISFTVDGAQYTVAEGTTIQQWLNSGDAPGYYVSSDGYLYNSSAGWYVVKDPYELISVNEVIYSGDVYTSREAPVPTITFYFNDYPYECKEGQTWRQMIDEYSDYSNTWGHVEITSDGYIKTEGNDTNDYIISENDLNNYTMDLEPVDNTIVANGRYAWVTAIKLTSNDTYSTSYMNYFPSTNAMWYIPQATIEAYYSEHGSSPQWGGLFQPYIHMSTTGTMRNYRDKSSSSDHTYEYTDHGILCNHSSSPYAFWFMPRGDDYTSENNSTYTFPASKIRCNGYFPEEFVNWLNNNFTLD